MGRLNWFKKLFVDPARDRSVILAVHVLGHSQVLEFEMKIIKAEAWANQCMKNGLYVHAEKTWLPPHRISSIEWMENVPDSNLASTKT